jgi:hypothetical protein
VVAATPAAVWRAKAPVQRWLVARERDEAPRFVTVEVVAPAPLPGPGDAELALPDEARRVLGVTQGDEVAVLALG